jgi:hypothetical protein
MGGTGGGGGFLCVVSGTVGKHKKASFIAHERLRACF